MLKKHSPAATPTSVAFFINGSEREATRVMETACSHRTREHRKPWQEGGEQEDPEEAGGGQWGWEGGVGKQDGERSLSHSRVGQVS